MCSHMARRACGSTRHDASRTRGLRFGLYAPRDAPQARRSPPTPLPARVQLASFRGRGASSPWLALVNVPANFTSDRRHGPAPGVDQDWFQQTDNQSPQGHWPASVLPTPCCVDTVMEPGRATRCAYHASRAGGCQSRWKGTRAQMTVAEHCPVACGRCLICPGHPREEAFEKSRRQWANGKM